MLRAGWSLAYKNNSFFSFSKINKQKEEKLTQRKVRDFYLFKMADESEK